MNKSDLLKQIAKAITKAAKSVDPKVVAKSAKMTAALSGARLADDLILDKIPGLKSAMIWTDDKISQGQQWLVDNTLGKIPGVGPIISKLKSTGTTIRHNIRDALFGRNDPQWYEHLPQHVPFNIPGGYNNKMVKFKVSGTSTTTIPSVATIQMVRNIVTTPYATSARYSEIYTAVKYARGLSYLPYDVNQMALLFELGNELTVLYYKLVKAVSAAFHFSMTKANLPKVILKSLNLTDVTDEYVGYCTLLDQMYNFMSVNTPLLPFIHKKLRQMCLFTAIDSEKPAMSTYIQAQVLNNNISVTEDGKGFYTNSITVPSNLKECKSAFQRYVDLITAGSGATSQLLNIIADIKGSLSSVNYVDNWRNIKFADTFTSDQLFLNSIKNLDLLPTFGFVGSYQASEYGFVCDQFVNAYQGTSSNPIKVSSGQSQPITLRFKSAQTASGLDAITSKYICCSGSKDVIPFAKNIANSSTPINIDITKDGFRKDNRLISLDGTENSEGKILETISLCSVLRKVSIEVPSGTSPCYANFEVDPSLFVAINVIVGNDYDDGETYTLYNVLNIPGWDLPDTVYKTMTSWTLVDWMPCVLITTFHSASQFYTGYLWDINGIGSLSVDSIETAIDYITYSLLSPGDIEALNKLDLANKLIESLNSK